MDIRVDKVCFVLEDVVRKFGCQLYAEWHYQYVRGSVRSFELRVYVRSRSKPSYTVADYLAARLRELGFGACRRPRDTFVTVRRGKEELAAILYRLGYLRDLLPPELSERTRRRVLEVLRRLEGEPVVRTVSEESADEYFEKLVQEVCSEYSKLVQKLGDEKAALRRIQEEYEHYVKLPLSLEEIRRRIAENLDYATWLTISDGVTSIIVDNNVDTLQYGTTNPALLSIVLKTYGFLRLTITGRDNKTGKPHFVATVNNEIATKLYGKPIPELDVLIRRVRSIVHAARDSLTRHLRSLGYLDETSLRSAKVCTLNATLRELYHKGLLTPEIIMQLADMDKHLLSSYVNDPVRALAGLLDGDGVVEQRGRSGYGVCVAASPYTVKGYAVLLLLKYLEGAGMIVLNRFNRAALKFSIWVEPFTREVLAHVMKHPLRAERMRMLSRSVTTRIAAKAIVSLRDAAKAVAEMLQIARRAKVHIHAEYTFVQESRSRILALRLGLVCDGTCPKNLATEIATALRKHGVYARPDTSGTGVIIRRGKVEIAFVLQKLGLIDRLIPDGVSKQLRKLILARVGELERELSEDREVAEMIRALQRENNVAQ